MYLLNSHKCKKRLTEYTTYIFRLMHQQETGLKNRIVRRWLPPKPMCDSSNRASQFISVSLREIYPMVQIFGFGLCVSNIILLLEIGFKTYMRHRRDHLDK